ncbi:AT-hook motif nuclear-localized protein 13-like [Benincasa hispida]|uniref:AT-hook motif nuclear-localized protein 13-like n=1 Tax=Benincasa hispida TaxID=102211 RepID=UPI0019004A7F|nr:AT-hook motif nuclear-localized protein 13-like [Benincasa hispida]
MDSRERSMPSVHQHQPQSTPPNRMIPNNASYSTNLPNSNNTSPLINPNSAAAQMMSSASRFPFNSMMGSSSKPSESPNAASYDGSQSELRTGGFNIDSGKKKRGRPRKYSPDGNIALGLSPTPITSSAVPGDSAGMNSPDPRPKKNRGRPPGTGKRQMDALGTGGVGFTPHVILVKPGEDIASKVMAFSQQGPRTVCILSAHGAVCNVTLQPAMAAGTVSYEGRYEIISLSGSFLISDNNGNRSRSGGLSVSLASADGQVLGGITNMLTAASTVQVIVGSFLVDGKKLGASIQKSGPSSTSPNMLNFSTPVAAGCPSEGASNNSSDDNGGSPLSRGPGIYTNANQPMHHNMQMYQLWGSRNQ